ncbi:hypothetical protein M9435_005255 [Picochlorum sp. BPE23]|nr:hypothetical protein M9435_005255 [Picochlorum sp. BPE23]
MEAVVVRIRRKSSKVFRACSGVILEDAGLVAVPFGLFFEQPCHKEETIRFDPSCVHQHDGIECAFESEPSKWISASVLRILLLWKYSSIDLEDVLCPEEMHATAGPLEIGHLGSTRESARIASSIVLVQCLRSSHRGKQPTCVEQVDGDIGTYISLPGSPFPQFLGTKFLHAKFNGMIAACMSAPMKEKSIRSSVYTDGPCLYILDAQVVPGFEGAPLIMKDTGAICGILGYPITSDRVGAVFHIGWPIRFIRHVMQAMMGMQQIPPATRHQRAYDKAMAHAVSIHTGDGCWASGYILDMERRVVVTNAHALPHEANVMVRCSRTGILHPGHILYSFEGILDMAFIHVPELHITKSTSSSLELSSTLLCGKRISILGFPLWCASQTHSQPIVTRGHVTSVLRDAHDKEAIFTTDAKVISGASGAIVLDDDTSHILGMVVSNTRIVHGSTYSIIYPTFNFCIPSTLIHRAYKAVLSGNSSINSIRKAFIAQGVKHVWDTLHTDAALSKL